MKLRPKAVVIVILTTTLVFAESLQTAAQDAPPDFKMLMNLDLFASRSSEVKGAPEMKDAPAPADDSMLDQIRALSAMGYLGDHHDSAGNAGRGNAPEPAPSSAPTEGVEGEYQ